MRLVREHAVFSIMCTLRAVVLRAGLELCCITEGSSRANVLKPSCILYGAVSQKNILVRISLTLNAGTVTRVRLCRITEGSSGADILKPSCMLRYHRRIFWCEYLETFVYGITKEYSGANIVHSASTVTRVGL